MQEKFTVTITQEHDQQAEVKNNFGELEGEWRDIYVEFSGYFGHHGPHKFAQGPVLYEALEFAALALEKTSNDTVIGRYAAGKARAALKLAKGE